MGITPSAPKMYDVHSTALCKLCTPPHRTDTCRAPCAERPQTALNTWTAPFSEKPEFIFLAEKMNSNVSKIPSGYLHSSLSIFFQPQCSAHERCISSIHAGLANFNGQCNRPLYLLQPAEDGLARFYFHCPVVMLQLNVLVFLPLHHFFWYRMFSS